MLGIKRGNVVKLYMYLKCFDYDWLFTKINIYNLFDKGF